MPIHSIPPVYDHRSAVLILGSFPSVRSREEGFFYGHPPNRFWNVISAVCGESVPSTIEEKMALLLRYRIALWDVVASCDIQGSSDSSMRNVVANDIASLLEQAPITAIFVNGKTAARYYDRLIKPVVQRQAIVLPSTSPANAAWSLERLIEAWQVIQQ